ncbi:hypothetical protein [Chishuiella sp.]|uniref:hypothetical protein n=1 Tax=Chishuiella sp. TaxID=1969467 RepID=UPI0028A8A82D|nr:hypothetical protein [Chishuiella sp.]
MSYRQFSSFNQLNNKNIFLSNGSLEKELKFQPYHKKIDLLNSNFGKVNYDMSNPNKSNDLPSFFLYGITNLFASLFN